MLIAICLSATSVSVAHATPPTTPACDPFREYSIERMLDAAAHLRSLGKEQGELLLKRWAREDADPLRTVVMCRMLYRPREGPMRRPLLGGPVLLGGTTLQDWEHEPIALVQGVPVLVTTGYVLGGKPESAESYLSACSAAGSWISKGPKKPTEQQLRGILEAFLHDPRWKRPLTEAEKGFLRAQLRRHDCRFGAPGTSGALPPYQPPASAPQ